MDASLKSFSGWKTPPRLVLALGAAVAAFLAAVVCYIQRSPPPAPTAPVGDSARYRPSGEPGRPYIEITPDHHLARVRHKDASGLSPLELVQTPQGAVRIQRTFSSSGVLLKETASLNGQPVPVPPR